MTAFFFVLLIVGGFDLDVNNDRHKEENHRQNQQLGGERPMQGGYARK